MAMQTRQSSLPPRGSDTGLRPDASPAPLRPLLEGARARGMADAFEMLGLPALLLDGQGRVLHASASTRKALPQGMAIVSEHLVASDGESNLALEQAISAALAGNQARVRQRELESGSGSLSFRVMPVEDSVADGAQLLQAILVFGQTELENIGEIGS